MEIELQPPRWYVARSNAHQEKLARASLLAEGIDAYLPMLPKTNAKGELYAVPLFPSFVFVRFALGGIGWTRVFSARGVMAVLGSGGRPTPLRGCGIEQIRYRELAAFDRAKLEAPPSRMFEAGEVVRIKKGPWAELDAVFQERIDARRCKVLMTIFEAERSVEVEFAHIEDWVLS